MAEYLILYVAVIQIKHHLKIRHILNIWIMNRSGLQIPSLKIMNEEFVIKLKEVAAIIRHKSAAF